MVFQEDRMRRNTGPGLPQRNLKVSFSLKGGCDKEDSGSKKGKGQSSGVSTILLSTEN